MIHSIPTFLGQLQSLLTDYFPKMFPPHLLFRLPCLFPMFHIFGNPSHQVHQLEDRHLVKTFHISKYISVDLCQLCCSFTVCGQTLYKVIRVHTLLSDYPGRVTILYVLFILLFILFAFCDFIH